MSHLSHVWFVILGWDLLRSVCIPNLKSLSTTIRKTGKVTRKIENVVVWGSYGSLKVVENNTIRHVNLPSKGNGDWDNVVTQKKAPVL